jgi:hypothetical protein
LFTRMYNRWYGFRGSLFNTPFGCVPKQGHKKTRTALALGTTQSTQDGQGFQPTGRPTRIYTA